MLNTELVWECSLPSQVDRKILNNEEADNDRTHTNSFQTAVYIVDYQE
jgi:hypothetical protein